MPALSPNEPPPRFCWKNSLAKLPPIAVRHDRSKINCRPPSMLPKSNKLAQAELTLYVPSSEPSHHDGATNVEFPMKFPDDRAVTVTALAPQSLFGHCTEEFSLIREQSMRSPSKIHVERPPSTGVTSPIRLLRTIKSLGSALPSGGNGSESPTFAPPGSSVVLPQELPSANRFAPSPVIGSMLSQRL